MKRSSISHRETSSLADLAYRQLEEMIVTLVLLPGASLSEAILSAKTGIGRTPIREALKRLEHQSLVTSMPRKGLIVRDMRVEDQHSSARFCQALGGAPPDAGRGAGDHSHLPLEGKEPGKIRMIVQEEPPESIWRWSLR